MMKIVQDISHCFDTGFGTVEKRDKPIILKDLRRLWEKHVPNLPWERGDFAASNTLLLDNHPCTALLNPVSLVYHFVNLHYYFISSLSQYSSLYLSATYCCLSP